MYNDESESLDNLYVVDGRRVSPVKKGVIQNNMDDNIPSTVKNAMESTMKNIAGKQSKKRANKGTYEEHYEFQEEYCIHQTHQVNQGITGCELNQDVTMCGSCPYRKSRTIKVKVSSASSK